jgi:hypothetical protein
VGVSMLSDVILKSQMTQARRSFSRREEFFEFSKIMQIFQSNSSILHILSEILDNQGKIEGKDTSFILPPRWVRC